MANKPPSIVFALPRLAVALSVICLGSCDELTPNGAPETITLLRSGSERVCVAPDVQKILRGLIVPKIADLDPDVSQSDASAAIAGISVAFDATTLEQYDKPISKAACNTVATLGGPTGTLNKSRISYTVSPSADQPNSVVVEGDASEARGIAQAQIETALGRATAAKAQQQQTLEKQEARQKLLATVSSRWLIGTWIANDADAANCLNGQNLTFRVGHVVEGTELNGRWVLNEDAIHAVGQGANGPAQLDGTITQADPLSFIVTGKDGGMRAYRRCSAEESHAVSVTGAPDTFVPVPSAPGQN